MECLQTSGLHSGLQHLFPWKPEKGWQDDLSSAILASANEKSIKKSRMRCSNCKTSGFFFFFESKACKEADFVQGCKMDCTAAHWGGENRTICKKVRTAIKHLEAAGCVAKTAYPNCTVFAIKNFDLFQAGASLRSNERQTTDKPTACNGQQNKKIEEQEERNLS